VLARQRESFVLFKNFSLRTLDRRRPLWKLAGEGKGALSCFHRLRAGSLLLVFFVASLTALSVLSRSSFSLPIFAICFCQASIRTVGDAQASVPVEVLPKWVLTISAAKSVLCFSGIGLLSAATSQSPELGDGSVSVRLL
jgi:hypothetical protein